MLNNLIKAAFVTILIVIIVKFVFPVLECVVSFTQAVTHCLINLLH